MWSHWERYIHCQEDQAAFKDPNTTSWWALEQEYQRPCYAAREQKYQLLQRPNLPVMTGEWKSAFGPTLITLFLIIHLQMRCHHLFLLLFLSCRTTIAPHGVKDHLMKTEGSSCQREIASSERKVVLITALKQGKKRQLNKPELTWRGRARGLSECWLETIQTNQSHGILVLVKAWYLILYLQYIKLYTYIWKLYHEYFYLYHIVSTFFCK